MSRNWRSGNSAEDGSETQGWILGHFIDPSQGVRSTQDVEVKWGIHPAGEKRAAWTADDQRTTLVILVSGNFRIDLSEGSITLERQGDYAIWGPGINHYWEAIAPSVVVTVRWPSSPS
jgi:quercetin dioxygenase-like cupin family protein